MTTSAAFLAERRREFGDQSGHVAALEQCCDLYRRRGLLQADEDAALFCVCPHGDACWNGLPHPTGYPAGITAPWIGERYFDRRICVVAMNLDHWGGLDANWTICRSHIEAQQNGHLGKAGRFFATGSMAYAAAVDAGLDGRSVPTDAMPDPRLLAATWSSCAFVEAVKCAPDTKGSHPSQAMFGNCPALLLREELNILKPRVVLLLGRSKQPRDSVRPLLNVRWGIAMGALERDTFVLDDGQVATLFSCNHPSAQNRNDWRCSYLQLIASLAEDPLRPNDP